MDENMIKEAVFAKYQRILLALRDLFEQETFDTIFQAADQLKSELDAYKNCSKDHRENCPDVKCWVQILRDKQMDEIEELKQRNQELEKLSIRPHRSD